MRVTSQMITTNMMSNINRNKVNMNKKGDQYATGQAIQKPSDDPVIAVRTLKYRTQLTKIEQYLDTNIPEALAWMEITEEALTGIHSLVQNINTYCNQAVNGYLELTDRDSIVATLEEYKEQLFELGNTDYAGRYVFSGYRTDTPLMFEKATNGKKDADYTTYTITEKLSYTDITTKSYIVGGAEYKEDITDSETYLAMAPSIEESNRLQLTYKKLDENGVSEVVLTSTDGTKRVITVDGTTDGVIGADGKATTVEAPKVVDENGNTIDDGKAGYKLVHKSIAKYEEEKAKLNPAADNYETEKAKVEKLNPYYAEPNQIVCIQETGELILGKNVLADVVTYSDISVTYAKTEFEKGDILPQHYFACTAEHFKKDAPTNPTETIQYTEPDVQKIEYEMNATQKLTVNTLAKDALTSSLCTKIDEIITSIHNVFSIKDQITKAETILKNAPDNQKEAIGTYIEQLKTEQVLAEKILTEAFSSGLTTTKQSEEKVNVAIADIGARYIRGELIQSRLEEQQTTVTELLSDIFYVDLDDAIIQYNSAQLYYNASLQCASKIVQNSLLDYLR